MSETIRTVVKFQNVSRTMPALQETSAPTYFVFTCAPILHQIFVLLAEFQNNFLLYLNFVIECDLCLFCFSL